jgi:hypothetical protein
MFKTHNRKIMNLSLWIQIQSPLGLAPAKAVLSWGDQKAQNSKNFVRHAWVHITFAPFGHFGHRVQHHGSKADICCITWLFVQICFQIAKIFSMHYKFYDSFYYLLFSNGLVHYYLVTSPSVDWMFNYLYYASLES